MNNLHNEILNIIDIGKTVDKQWDESDIIAKLFEEGGEFSRAVQIKRGKILREQPLTEDFDECADVMICAIDALARVNGLHDTNTTAEDIDSFIKTLCTSLQLKSAKWKRKINEFNSSKRK